MRKLVQITVEKILEIFKKYYLPFMISYLAEKNYSL